ncbi:E motif [Dillenia turbinata]|uniref:E motif n=1 Tax=Dillenia turbinata TaxID=194707 RepID=A0AAN8Z734_9MAGN
MKDPNRNGYKGQLLRGFNDEKWKHNYGFEQRIGGRIAMETSFPSDDLPSPIDHSTAMLAQQGIHSVTGAYDVLGPHLNSSYSNYHYLRTQLKVPYCYLSPHLRISFPTRNSVPCCSILPISNVNNTKNAILREIEPHPPQNYISSGRFSSKQSLNSVSVEIEETSSQKQFKDSGFYRKMSLIDVLEAVGGNWDLEMGRQFHGYLLKLGECDDIFVSNSLLGMYTKCGAIEDASTMFESMCKKDSVSWNTIISGFQQSHCYVDSFSVLRQMIQEFKLYPNRVACISALSSCASLELLIHGQEIHAFVLKSGLDVDECLVSCLIDMYMKCGDIRNAKCIFQHVMKIESLKRNSIIWNVMIMGYVHNRHSQQSVEMFFEMLVFGIQPDSSTMVAILVQCSQSSNLELGRQVHGLIYRFGLENDVRVKTALLDMYFKSGDPQSGLKIFNKSQSHNLVMVGAVLTNLSYSTCPTNALEIFCSFSSDCRLADPLILLAVLRACSSSTLKTKGMEMHGLVAKMGLDYDVYVGGALVDMYAKCKDIESAEKAFARLSARDLISWNALICGYAQNGSADTALHAFHTMQSENIRPNAVTLSNILSVSAHISIRTLCKEIHGYSVRRGFEHNVLMSNSMITAYAKCGDINSSRSIFGRMPEKDVSCRSHGNEKLAESVADYIFKLDPASVGYRVLLSNIYGNFGKWNEVTRIRTKMKDMGLNKLPGCSWIEVDNKVHVFNAGDRSHEQSVEIYAVIGSLVLEIKMAERNAELKSIPLVLNESYD